MVVAAGAVPPIATISGTVGTPQSRRNPLRSDSSDRPDRERRGAAENEGPPAVVTRCGEMILRTRKEEGASEQPLPSRDGNPTPPLRADARPGPPPRSEPHLEPTARRIVVVKSTNHFMAAFGPIADQGDLQLMPTDR